MSFLLHVRFLEGVSSVSHGKVFGTKDSFASRERGTVTRERQFTAAVTQVITGTNVYHSMKCACIKINK